MFGVLAFVLILPALGVWVALAKSVQILSFLPSITWALVGGALSYGLVHFLIRRPMTLYVFGHELTHAMAGVLSGYKVKSLFVSEKGGEVELSDSNAFVALAPYCIPLFTVLVLLLNALVRHYTGWMRPPFWVSFAIGVTYAFHVVLTIHALRQGQPDLREAGPFFSVVMIALCNGLVWVWILDTLAPKSMDVTLFFVRWWEETRGLFLAAARWAQWVHIKR